MWGQTRDGRTWYERGLPEAIARTDVFIVALDATWDSSTWMAEEAREAIEVAQVTHAFYWDPHGVPVRAMHGYLRRQLASE